RPRPARTARRRRARSRGPVREGSPVSLRALARRVRAAAAQRRLLPLLRREHVEGAHPLLGGEVGRGRGGRILGGGGGRRGVGARGGGGRVGGLRRVVGLGPRRAALAEPLEAQERALDVAAGLGPVVPARRRGAPRRERVLGGRNRLPRGPRTAS